MAVRQVRNTQAIEQLGEQRVPAVGADVAGGLGEELRAGGHGGAVDTGAARAGAAAGRVQGCRSRRMAALRWRPETATTSSNSWPFRAREARR
jgi:hypothetical protein